MISATRVIMAEFLGTEDVAKWQSVDVATWKTFKTVEDYNVWKRCAERQFPHLFGDVALYEGGRREMFLRCHALLLRANYALGSILTIDTEEEAAFLCHQLRTATLACETHLGASGTQGHVLLGEFELDRLSYPTEFQFGQDGRSPLAGLPAGILQLNILVDGSRWMTRALYGIGPFFSFQPILQSPCVRLMVDVASADQAMPMSCIGMRIALDGSWQSSMVGLDLETFRQHEPHQQPCLCVLVLKDDESSRTDDSS
eukprot:TRINITY_DN3563_c0_g5_i1.p1 TRINITY_DN3563_c0_g5~~TRINITY_DN3563_c0_g5_i1.p1  ORF type:complete len:257 (-),score=22.06 TRINITY_DN3563_c0_g5_i1:412-1182(-)